MSNNKILILEGGYNEEHEVSLKSSLEIQKILNKIKLKFILLRVNPKNFEVKISKYKNFSCINALHGSYGEDGKIQKILKNNNIRYSHSGILSSKNCFNKVNTKKIIKKNKILTPKFLILKKKKFDYKALLSINKNFKKFVIKPTNSGSSFGVKIIKSNKDFNNFINEIEDYKKNLPKNNKILIEEFISGKELTVSTIKFSQKIQPLAVTEINYKNTFFDYKAKYSKGYSKHFLPARISKKNYEKCLNIASKAHKLLGCNSIARTDFIFDTKKNQIFLLEINTQPGMTSLSLLPEQAKYKNISFEKIILGIIENLN